MQNVGVYVGPNVAISGNYAILGTHREGFQDLHGGRDQGKAFIYHRAGDNWILQATLMGKDVVKYDFFGRTVDIDGDHAIVGAKELNNKNSDGYAHVYKRTDTKWKLVARLKSPKRRSRKSFGEHVVIDGEYAAVSAPGDKSRTGSVYIFKQAGDDWLFQYELQLESQTKPKRFGYALAICGDYIAVGARDAKVHVYYRSGSEWNKQAVLNTIEDCDDCYAVTNISISEDHVVASRKEGGANIFKRTGSKWQLQTVLDHDDYPDLHEHIMPSVSIFESYCMVTGKRGTVYVYQKSITGWELKTNLKIEGLFGRESQAVSISEDVAIVSTYNGLFSHTAGQTAICHLSHAGWGVSTVLELPDIVEFDGIGSNVSISPEYAVMGVCTADIGDSVNQGVAHVFKLSNGKWDHHAVLRASNGTSHDMFGVSVALSDDNIVVGAHQTSGAGSAYVFDLSKTRLEQQDLFGRSWWRGEYFYGSSVAMSNTTIFVGGVMMNTGHGNVHESLVYNKKSGHWTEVSPVSPNQGNFGTTHRQGGMRICISEDYLILTHNNNGSSLTVFRKRGTNWKQHSLIRQNEQQQGNRFGNSISLSGNTAIVGARNHNVRSKPEQGMTYIFERSGTKWDKAARLIASDGDAGDCFGQSVSISGDYALIGADYHNTNGNRNQGKAYIFYRSGSAWSQQALLVASDGQALDYFGKSVFISGDFAIIGTNSGKAYIFQRSGTEWTQRAVLSADGATD